MVVVINKSNCGALGGSWEYFEIQSFISQPLNLRSILVLDMVGEVREREGVWIKDASGE